MITPAFPASALLYGILDLGYLEPGALAAAAEAMALGGVDIFQLRAKGRRPSEIEALAAKVLPVVRASGRPLIINDHPEVAAAVGADGVHVGQDDTPVAEARRILGPGRIVGLSTHSRAQALEAVRQGPDYIGFGPLMPTPTKPEYRPVGLDAIAGVRRDAAVPVFCIGGIHLANLPAVLAAGARRVVIVSGMLLAADLPGYVRQVKTMLLEAEAAPTAPSAERS